MIQVYRLVTDGLSQTVEHQQSAQWYSSSEQAFVYSNKSQIFKWWPPSGPDPPPQLALVKLSTNLSKTASWENSTTKRSTINGQKFVYLSANCSLLVRTTGRSQDDVSSSSRQLYANTASVQSHDYWRLQTLGEQINLPLSECSPNEEDHFYYECEHQQNVTRQLSLVTGTALLYIRHLKDQWGSSTHQAYLFGLYIGINKRSGKTIFLSLNSHFLQWTVRQMTGTVLISTKATTIFWSVFITIFNVLPFLLLLGPLLSLLFSFAEKQ